MLRDELKGKRATLDEIEKHIQDNKNKLSQINEGILILEKFLELYQDLPSLLAKTTELSVKDSIAQKIFLNLFVDEKKVTFYKLNSPFKEFLETKNTSKTTKVPSNGDEHPYLELLHVILASHELLSCTIQPNRHEFREKS